jgi:hypothetical protein
VATVRQRLRQPGGEIEGIVGRHAVHLLADSTTQAEPGMVGRRNSRTFSGVDSQKERD